VGGPWVESNCAEGFNNQATKGAKKSRHPSCPRSSAKSAKSAAAPLLNPIGEIGGIGGSAPARDPVTLGIGEGAPREDELVDQRPDAEAAEGDELEQTGPDLAHIESVDAEHADEGAQEERRQQALVAGGVFVVPPGDRTAFAIPTGAAEDQDEIDDGPDAEAAQGQQLEQAKERTPGVESMHAKDAEIEGEDRNAWDGEIADVRRGWVGIGMFRVHGMPLPGMLENGQMNSGVTFPSGGKEPVLPGSSPVRMERG